MCLHRPAKVCDEVWLLAGLAEEPSSAGRWDDPTGSRDPLVRNDRGRPPWPLLHAGPAALRSRLGEADRAPYVGHRLGPAHSTDEVEVVDVLEHVLEVAQLP